MMNADRILAGVELGGTKCVALLGRGETVVDRVQVPTTDPAGTLSRLRDILSGWQFRHEVAALGIGSFGPIRIQRDAADYGRMLATPKSGWADADIAGALIGGFPAHALHTDVTAAALAERAHGAGRGLDNIVYLTIGTGIGMGALVGGLPVTGTLHPEAGHVRVRRLAGDTFAGICPAHGDCLEGIASGPAIAARFGGGAALPDPTDPRWRPIADALGEAIATLLLTLSPQRIIIGGGAGLGQPALIAQARDAAAEKLAGYLPDCDGAALSHRVVPAALGAEAGPRGTLILASHALAAARAL